MHKDGFKGVSMDDIATEAGIKKANLFHYYPTKEELGISVLDYISAYLREGIVLQMSGDQKDPIKIINGMFQEKTVKMRESQCCQGCFMGNLAQELSDYNERFRAKISEHLQFWSGQLAGLLERARIKGYFKKEFKTSESAEAILSLLEGAILFSKASKRVSALENAEKMAVRYLQIYKA